MWWCIGGESKIKKLVVLTELLDVSLFLLKDSKADVLSVKLSSFIVSDEGLALKTNPNSIVELSKYQCFLSVH